MRSRAVTALKSPSHEPQSRSIASLVRSVVVSGPGVSRILSRSMVCLLGCSRRCVRHAWVRRSTHQASAMNSSVAMVEATPISTAIAAAAPISPASSRFRMAIDATLVSGEYRNTTAEIVVIALMKK